MVGAIGVVFGDIGTSPLYTLKEVFAGHYGVRVDAEGVLGILSLILWSLLWVVSLKYVLFMLRADNGGEGGVMALTALARRATAAHPRLSGVLVLLGLAVALDWVDVPYGWVPAAVGLPLGLTLAVLLYRFEDLDLYVHRGVVWLVLTALAVALRAVAQLHGGQTFAHSGEGLTEVGFELPA